LPERSGDRSLGPVEEIELPASLGVARVDAEGGQAAQVLVAQLRIDDVEGLLAALEALLDEGKQGSIFVVWAAEEPQM
jgi:hypothetical protein